MTNLDWYSAITPFSEFNELTADAHYHCVPAEWSVIVADIEGSTRAITQGRYKDVNTLGAACIIAAQNAMNRAEFPYVFGGDGATLVVPESQLARVQSALESVVALARVTFDMTLRVGSVRVDELARMGCKLEVAKFRLVGKQTIAMFRGGALAKAEEIVKLGVMKVGASTLTLSTTPEDADPGNLDGLSCRWQPIPSLHGRIATVMVSACGDESKQMREIYSLVLARFDAILSGDVRTALPLHHQNMRYRGILELLRDEWRYEARRTTLRFMRRLLGIALSVAIFKWRIPRLISRRNAYESSLGAHSDFRKFDGTLRMVIDVTQGQLSAIHKMLDEMRMRGEIRYGLHESDTALMTCFVYGLGDGEHIHFVDGSDGGYALAARQMKSQSKSQSK